MQRQVYRSPSTIRIGNFSPVLEIFPARQDGIILIELESICIRIFPKRAGHSSRRIYIKKEKQLHTDYFPKKKSESTQQVQQGFTCHECGKVCANQGNLVNHMKAKHPVTEVAGSILNNMRTPKSQHHCGKSYALSEPFGWQVFSNQERWTQNALRFQELFEMNGEVKHGWKKEQSWLRSSTTIHK